MELTQAAVRELLDYDPDSGVFTWRRRDRKWFKTDRDLNARNARFAGKPAGCPNSIGYTRININGKFLAAHRLAFLWMTGAWPAQQVDHHDRDRTNNRWDNLRDATHRQNMINRLQENSTGARGVNRKHQKFRARIHHNNREIHLGTFDTAEAAARAYDAKALELHGEFAVLNFPQENTATNWKTVESIDEEDLT